MMRRTPFTRKTPMRAYGPSKGPGLAQRIAQSLGTAINYKHSAPSVFRSEAHRRNVAAMACICCGIEKRSQCAHLNLLALGKGRGWKVSDALTIPLCCTTFGRVGCHVRLDSAGVYDKATSEALQITWLHKNRDRMIEAGQWPKEADADLVRFVGAYLQRTA